ncbi:carboxymuconolactone decarboxylase family protein [Streptomyces bathyalis]|uniref:Carboxymuconolactone decarboxylase family protein n=1 Tax=Streptomyces bathyalis TaxID=2710756 RepID=A0A7T1TDY1_9ACTN|nr:carboxymuconolactone decarboxylase family protein [Streptomyces bathyalis]
MSPPYDEDTERLLAKLMPPQSDIEPLLLFRVFARHRELFGRLIPMAAGLLTKGLLPARDREVVISRITARAGAEYEWGVHAVLFGPAVGLDQELLDAIATQPADASAFDERTRLLVTAVDELHDQATVSADTWGRLAQVYDEPRLLELLLVAGWYRTFSAVITSVALPHESWAARFPLADSSSG